MDGWTDGRLEAGPKEVFPAPVLVWGSQREQTYHKAKMSFPLPVSQS